MTVKRKTIKKKRGKVLGWDKSDPQKKRERKREGVGKRHLTWVRGVEDMGGG